MDTKHNFSNKVSHLESHADFTIDEIENVVIITDLDKGNKSVTNDIEFVLRCIFDNSTIPNLKSKKFIYRDSMGYYDGLKQIDGKFLSWYPIHEKDLKAALTKAK